MLAKVPSNNNYETTNLEELIDLVQTLQCNAYQGFDDLTQPEAIVYPTKSSKAIIHIEYDDVLDCKRTERALKSVCSKFFPRKYGSWRLQSVGLSVGCKQELDKLKKDKQSYEQVIWGLILEHYDNAL